MRGVASLLVATLAPLASAHAYTLASPVTTGCHERLTSIALRTVRAELAWPPLAPETGDDHALLADLPFPTEPDLGDLEAASLLIGVRDNDLKGNDITGGVDLVQVHGDPAGQREHCLRAPTEDEPDGSERALAGCRAFIRDTALAALDGLDSTGVPARDVRVALPVSLAVRGRVDTRLPLFYVRAGQALHALQDGFTHTFRTGGTGRVTTVLNWVDFAEEDLDERRDGPAHLVGLDSCDHLDAMRSDRLERARQASVDLLRALLDSGPSPAEPAARAGKAAEVDEILDRSLGFQSGCTFENRWCDAPERALGAGEGCACDAGRSPGAPAVPAAAWVGAVALACAVRDRKRSRRRLGARGQTGARPRRASVLAASIAIVAWLAGGRARGDELDADDVPLTPAELAALRDIRASGPRLGVTVAVGASLDRSAAAGSLGARFRISSRWVAGADVEWNPWFAAYPLDARPGSLNIYGTLIRRYPMRFERVNLRTTVHVGISALLFDLYGAREGSLGPYFGITPLGIDVHIRRGWKLVFDPLGLELPIPHVTGVPLYYEQFRLSVGLQYGG